MSDLFRRLDYTPFRLRSQCVIAAPVISYDPLAWNYGLIPRESLPLFSECCRTHGLEMFRPYDAASPAGS